MAPRHIIHHNSSHIKHSNRPIHEPHCYLLAIVRDAHLSRLVVAHENSSVGLVVEEGGGVGLREKAEEEEDEMG